MLKEADLVKKMNEYFNDSFSQKDYASVWIEIIKPHLYSETPFLDTGPKNNQAIYLAQQNNTYLWWAPAGNLPDAPELIVLGQSTSRTALEYIMSRILDAPDYEVPKILASSIYRGQMLSNLGVMLKFLEIERVFDDIETFINEWSNVCDSALGHVIEPEGRLFNGSRDSHVMFTQACMHCATKYNNGRHNASSKHLRDFLDIYHKYFPNHLYNVLRDKFFLNNRSKLMIVLSLNLYEIIRASFVNEYSNVYWADFRNQQPIICENQKIVTWIHHPSPRVRLYANGGALNRLINMFEDEELIDLDKATYEFLVNEYSNRMFRGNTARRSLAHHLWLKYYIHHLTNKTLVNFGKEN